MLFNSTVGTNLIGLLEQYGVEFVFGIPGVHTVELYRGLNTSQIRHVTARHEQSAGFMADGYARISGKPGVCFVITGPGLTNILTAMAQARSDSIPMLVISSTNKFSDIKAKKAPLHSLPDQSALAQQIALASFTVDSPAKLSTAVSNAFRVMTDKRPGPVHIQIPTDIMAVNVIETTNSYDNGTRKKPIDPFPAIKIQALLDRAESPIVIIGGGARNAKTKIPALAELLEAPVISTTNARDIMGNHPLHISASPSLPPVRKTIKEADLVIAIGTEMGSTDFDFYEDNLFPEIKTLIRVDIDDNLFDKDSNRVLNLRYDSEFFCSQFLDSIISKHSDKAKLLVKKTMDKVRESISEDYAQYHFIIECIVSTLPDAIIVGDSTQITYAGNFCCSISRKNRWFNSATGYGTLGFAPSASIGAKLAEPMRPVVCLVGDGGFQFCLSDLGTALDENTPVIFILFNNSEYKEIRTFMEGKGIEPIGTRPTPPNFKLLSKSYSINHELVRNGGELSYTISKYHKLNKPVIIEIFEHKFSY